MTVDEEGDLAEGVDKSAVLYSAMEARSPDGR